MSRTYEIETLLRPPAELFSALTAFAVGGVCAFAPDVVMTPPAVAWPAGAAIALLVGLPRLRAGLAVLAYQRNLRRLPTYTLLPTQIPLSRHRLFLGRGFRWLPIHTQRLLDTMRPEVRAYIEPGRIDRAARHLARSWEHTAGLRQLAQLIDADAWWNPVRPLPPVGGNPLIHAVEPDEGPVTIDLRDRVGHMLVLGTTRVGKTRLLEVLVTQDIARGDTVIVFDPKGDAELLRRVYVEACRAGRQQELSIFHLGFPHLSARYNAIGSFNRITEVATRIANQLPAGGDAQAFRDFAWRFTNIIACALIGLGRRPDYRQIRHYINDIDPLFEEYARAWLARGGPTSWAQELAAFAGTLDQRSIPSNFRGRRLEPVALYLFLQRMLHQQQTSDPVLAGLLNAFRYDRTWYDKIISSLGPLLEKLTSGKTAELLAPDYFDTADARPIFDWRQVIRRRGIVYVGLDALADATVSSAVGNSMFADLVSVAGELYKHGSQHGLPNLGPTDAPRISIHADEFNELIGDEFIPLVNKAGGAGMQITAYTQTWSDIEARIGNRAKAGVITGNFNTVIMLRVRDQATAELLTSQLPQIEVQQLTAVSGVTDATDPTAGTVFVSRNEDRLSTQRVPMLLPADIMSLPKGQAFALLHGGQLWKMRLPLPRPGREEAALPRDIEGIAERLRRTRRLDDSWYRPSEALIN